MRRSHKSNDRAGAFALAVLGVLALCASLVITVAGGCASADETDGPSAPFTAVQATASASTSQPATSSVTASTTPTRPAPLTFAIIGDYGTADAHERAVAKLVASWKPVFVVAAGDDYYAPARGTGTGKYDNSTGAFYARWLKDITTTGAHLAHGPAKKNAFFPALGNHDYSDATPSPKTYLTYFRLPGAGFTNSSHNERFYDFVEGPLHFFILNSNSQEPSGTSKTSKQAKWLKARLASSKSTWNVVVDHHPPYSSDSTHGSSRTLRWPFATWGADAVISGHAHVYERIVRNRIVYFIDGLGGAQRYAFRKTPVSGSALRYRANWGAMRATATTATLTFEFYNVNGSRVDRYRLTHH
jgi:tartrate-resistant acid phosphatase type 5